MTHRYSVEFIDQADAKREGSYRTTKNNHKPPNSASELKMGVLPKQKSKTPKKSAFIAHRTIDEGAKLFLVQNDFSLALPSLMRKYCDHRSQNV
jgi:hypothetical protein